MRWQKCTKIFKGPFKNIYSKNHSSAKTKFQQSNGVRKFDCYYKNKQIIKKEIISVEFNSAFVTA